MLIENKGNVIHTSPNIHQNSHHHHSQWLLVDRCHPRNEVVLRIFKVEFRLIPVFFIQPFDTHYVGEPIVVIYLG